LPVEYSSSDCSTSDSESSTESDNKEINSVKHSPSDRFDDTRYLTELSLVIDHDKDFIEDLESLFPLKTVEIRENRDASKEFCDLDKNYPFDPVPKHLLRFFALTPSGRLLFKASHRQSKRTNKCWTDYRFDSLFILPQGQFVFRVKRVTTFGSHLFRCHRFGNSAVVSTGDFGKKYVGKIIQIFCFGKRRFEVYDSTQQLCLIVEGPRSAWAKPGPKQKLTASLEFKFPNGKLFATMDFDGNCDHPRVWRKFSLRYPSLICQDSITTIKFEDSDIRLPVQLRAFVLGSYLLFYHQYWEYRRVGWCPFIMWYIIFITALIVTFYLCHTKILGILYHIK